MSLDALVPAFIGQIIPEMAVEAVRPKRCVHCGMRKSPMTIHGLQGFPAHLTEVERRTVVLLCMGLQNKEIADRMNTTAHVIKNRFRFIFGKVGCADRVQLLIRMMKFKYEGM